MVVGTGCPFAETVQVVDQYCNLFHRPADGAFGEALVSQLSPAFQIDGLYGLDSSDFKLNNSNDGLNYVSNDGLMTIETGSSVGSFSTLRSNRSIRYRPGQGALCPCDKMSQVLIPGPASYGKSHFQHTEPGIRSKGTTHYGNLALILLAFSGASPVIT